MLVCMWQQASLHIGVQDRNAFDSCLEHCMASLQPFELRTTKSALFLLASSDAGCNHCRQAVLQHLLCFCQDSVLQSTLSTVKLLHLTVAAPYPYHLLMAPLIVRQITVSCRQLILSARLWRCLRAMAMWKSCMLLTGFQSIKSRLCMTPMGIAD